MSTLFKSGIIAVGSLALFGFSGCSAIRVWGHTDDGYYEPVSVLKAKGYRKRGDIWTRKPIDAKAERLNYSNGADDGQLPGRKL